MPVHIRISNTTERQNSVVSTYRHSYYQFHCPVVYTPFLVPVELEIASCYLQQTLIKKTQDPRGCKSSCYGLPD